LDPIKEKDVTDPLTHEHDVAAMVDPNIHHGHTPEEIRKEMRVYLTVFAGLAVLTAATVGACYGLKDTLSVHATIAVALVIAATKGFLVAGFFMHLLSERKVIYGVLILTLFFFAVLLWGPWHHNYDMFGR
jgi:caa(3)-type oxidase subunit IV